jgi:ABC-2 type transport system permease protein
LILKMAFNTLAVATRLAAKDLRLYARDRAGLALGFLLPIALITVMGLVFQNMAGDGGMPKPAVSVADFDGTEASRVFTAGLGTGPAEVKPWNDAGPPRDRDDVVARVKKGRPSLVLVIGAGFAAALEAGKEPPLELVCDLSKNMEIALLEQAVMTALMDAHGEKVGRLMTLKGVAALGEGLSLGEGATKALESMARGFFDRFERELATKESRPAGRSGAAETKSEGKTGVAGFPGLAAAFGMKVTKVGGEGIGGGDKEKNRIGMVCQSVAGTAVMMLLFGLVACGTTLLSEAEEGTLRRLLLTPAPRNAILLGKFLYCFVVGLAQLVVMFAYGRFAFGLPVERHLGGVAAFACATAAAATGFGVLLAVLGRTRKQVEGLSTLIILVMSAVGGAWFPLFIMPKLMQTLSRFTLTAWAMEGFNGLFWYDLPLSELLLPLGVLFAVAATLYLIASAVFRKRFA